MNVLFVLTVARNAATSWASSLLPSQWCQFIFVLLGTVVLSFHFSPIRSHMLAYGGRAEDPSVAKVSLQSRVLAHLLLLNRIPHAWFSHFYVASTVFSIFWGYQLLKRGAVLRCVATWEVAGREAMRGALPTGAATIGSGASSSGSSSIGIGSSLGSSAGNSIGLASNAGTDMVQVWAVWGMLFVQSCRRLYESLFVMKPSNSTMLALHSVATILFYFSMNVSVWIEGSAALLDANSSYEISLASHAALGLCLLVFLAASVQQTRCHLYLSSLVKYTLPERGLFRYFVCPHYTCECVIYLAFTVAAAPSGQMFSRVFLAATYFVVANLASTADSTRQWYVKKFGADKVGKRWAMIPFVF